jgi:hypothetical protein
MDDAFFLPKKPFALESLAAFRLIRPRARKRDAEPEVLKLIDTLYTTWKNIPLGKYENTSQGISGINLFPARHTSVTRDFCRLISYYIILLLSGLVPNL